MTIDYAQLTFEDTGHIATTCASDIGLKPGQWPNFIAVVSVHGHFIYYRENVDQDRGVYRQQSFWTHNKLIIWND